MCRVIKSAHKGLGLVLAIALMVPGTLSAADLSAFDVYYINGMFTDEDRAQMNNKALASKLGKLPILLHNTSHYWLLQLLDVYVEKSGEAGNPLFSNELFWKMVRGVVPGSQLFMAAMSDVTYQNQGIGPWSQNDYYAMLNAIKGSLNNDKKVLVIPHSQGNFFYNNLERELNAWNSKKTQECFGGVGLASTLSSVLGNYSWVTNSNDDIINAIRLGWPGTLSANVAVPGDYNGDSTGHGLRETYLSHVDSINLFDSKVNSTVQSLNSTCVTPPACAVPLGKVGGQGHPTYSYNLTNTTPHVVEISFEAYDIPDSITIRANNGVIASTNGLVSGFHTWRVNYNPAVHGNVFTAEINAPDAGTAWQLCIDCDGKNCKSSGTPLATTTIYYNFNDPRSNPWYVGCDNLGFMIDGQPVSRSGYKALVDGAHVFSYHIPSGACYCTSMVTSACENQKPGVNIGGYHPTPYKMIVGNPVLSE